MEARLLGKTLAGKYRIERVLGAGGMGTVYAAEEIATGRRVAVKVIHSHLPTDSPGLVQRFEREARAAGSIDTEHITRCLDTGTDPESNDPYMVLEYLVGEDLQHLIRRLGPIHPNLALKIVAQACTGLVAAHRANVVHRDIKPANIFLAKTGEGVHTVKLLDFGVAKIRRDPSEMSGDTAGLTQTGSMLGSPLYMSPEQARSTKNVDHRTDVWSMGVVLYQAVAGRTPYDHISGLGDLILALCSDLPPPVQQFAPWVDPEVAAVIDHALRVDLRERFQTAAEMLEAIRGLCPDGIEIHDDMMVALDDATHDHIAPTFFRNLGGLRAQRASSPSAPSISGPPPAPTLPPYSVPSPGPDAPPAAPRASDPEPPRPGFSVPPPRPTQTSETAVATTGPGLGVTASGTGGTRSPRSRSMSTIAIVLASVLAGGAGVYLLTRQGAAPPPPMGVAAGTATPQTATPPTANATTPTPATAVPTTLPAPTIVPSATVEPAASAPVASAAPSVTPSAVPRAKSTGTPKVVRPDHSVYGDRK